MKSFLLAALATTSILTANAQSVSEDMLMHDLIAGPVKRYVQYSDKYDALNFADEGFNTSWVYFDTNGTLQRDGIWKVIVCDNNGRYVRGQFPETTVTRNERGHITHMASGLLGAGDAYYDDTYTYTQYGKRATLGYESVASSGLVTYTYNDANELVSTHTEYDAEGNEGIVDETYTIIRRDSYGNWIERSGVRTEQEKIDGKLGEPTRDEFFECRCIEYYQPGEKSYSTERFIIPVTVKGTNVRLRLGPSTDSPIYAENGKTVYPAKGEKLIYLGETDDFYRVKYKGAEVYISKQFSERQMEYFLMW